MEKKPLTRLERIKAEKEKYSLPAVRKAPLPKKPMGGPVAIPGKKTLSDASIDLIAKALQTLIKE